MRKWITGGSIGVILIGLAGLMIQGFVESRRQTASYEIAMAESQALIAKMDADRDRPSVVSTGIYEVSAGFVVGATTTAGAITALGAPDSRSSLSGGGSLLQWVALTPSAAEHVALVFDRQDILREVQTRSRVTP